MYAGFRPMSHERKLSSAHLVVYLPDLSGGGAERLHVGLAPAFLAAGLRVTFLVHRRRGELLEVCSGGRARRLARRRAPARRASTPGRLFATRAT